MKKTNILIVGFGNIGKRIYEDEFSSFKYDVAVYDKALKADTNYKVKVLSKTLVESWIFDIAIVCVPDEEIISTLNWLSNEVMVQLIWLRSTPKPDDYKKLDEYNKVIYTPEFKSATPYGQKGTPYYIIGASEKCDVPWIKIFAAAKINVLCMACRIKEAYCIKLCENYCLSVQVLMGVACHSLAENMHVDYSFILPILQMDNRIAQSHMLYIDGYYDTHCLNKDTAYFREISGDLFSKMCNIANEELKATSGDSQAPGLSSTSRSGRLVLD